MMKTRDDRRQRSSGRQDRRGRPGPRGAFRGGGRGRSSSLGKGRGASGGRGMGVSRGRGGGRGRGARGKGRGGVQKTHQPVRKQLVRTIIDLMCQNGPMRSVHVAQALGFATKFEINPTLYYMRRNNLVHQERSKTLKWGLPDAYNHEFYRWMAEQNMKTAEEEEIEEDVVEDEDESGEDEVTVLEQFSSSSASKSAMPTASTPDTCQEGQQGEATQMLVLKAMKSRPLGTASLSQLETLLQMSPERITQSLELMAKTGIVSLVSKDQSLWVLTTKGEEHLLIITQKNTPVVGDKAKGGSSRPLPPHLYMTVNPDFAPSEGEKIIPVSEAAQSSGGGVGKPGEETETMQTIVTTTGDVQVTEATTTTTSTPGAPTASSTSTQPPLNKALPPSNRPLPPHMVEMARTGKLPDGYLGSHFYLCNADAHPAIAKPIPLMKTHQYSTLSKESYAILNKNPISTLMEYAQARQLQASIDVLKTFGPAHKQRFVLAAKVGDRVFPRVDRTNKKEARREAADVAVRLLVEEGAFNTEGKKKKGASTTETPMDTSPGTPPVVSAQVAPSVSQSGTPTLNKEIFSALNKNPVSALTEYAQARQLPVQIELLTQHGPPHAPNFVMAVTLAGRQFPWVTRSSKKEAKTEAAETALRTLIAEGTYNPKEASSGPKGTSGEMTHFDKIAALSHEQFNTLAAKVIDSSAGRKVIAAIIVQRGEDSGRVISVGSGNRCITGNQLSLEGNTVNDSHAEIIARRGFLRFLYKQLLLYRPGEPNELLEPSPSGKVKIKGEITFHLYISTAPCGDGALFSPRDCENKSVTEEDTSRDHHPTFTSNVQGLLRTKMEGGEGTIPIEPEFEGQSFDGIQRGERLRTMSCTDKICRWNVVGMQGALLSYFLEPVYLDSLTLGYLYDHGHLARAVCCRLDRGNTPISDMLPAGYRLNHPWLGRVTMCDPPRETQKTKSDSLNWCLGDEEPEVVDGTMGICNTKVKKKMFSRVRKRALFKDFQAVCRHFGRSDILALGNYNNLKKHALDFQTAKEAMLKVFKANKCGPWVGKPVEEEMFS